jgi:MFS family permease
VTNWLYAPGIALTQSLAPPHARGTAAAIFYLLSNVAGAGFGPVMVGLLSDAFEPRFGAESVRYAILTLSGLYAWAAVHFFLAGRRLADGQDQATV